MWILHQYAVRQEERQAVAGAKLLQVHVILQEDQVVVEAQAHQTRATHRAEVLHHVMVDVVAVKS